MSDPFNIYNWYWKVGDQSPGTQVYSTASNSFVPLSDTTYTTWTGRGNVATVIDTMANLYSVFNSNCLAAYIEKQQTTSSAVDITLTNPVPSIAYITMTAASKKVTLPRMDTPSGIYIGGRFEIANSGSVNAFNVVAADGTTVLATIPTGVSYIFTLLANNTQNGNIQVRSTSVKVTVQIFVSSGTYTPTPGMKYCTVECIGGGGGGGAARGLANQCYAGGGGGSGAYSRVNLTAAQVGASQAITAGAGGGGGSMGASGIGGTGSTTSFGALCLANGGIGGYHSASGLQYGYGGSGGNITGAVGDIKFWGAPGGGGFYGNGGSPIVPSGFGGSGPYGGGAPGQFAVGAIVNGVSGHEWGSGGSGGNTNAVGDAGGGLGANGACIITEYS